MGAPSNLLKPAYYTSADLEELGITIDADFILSATSDFWRTKDEGLTNSLKAYLPIPPASVFSTPDYAEYEKKYRNTTLDLRVGSLNGIVGMFCGVKFLHSNPVNIDLGLPRQQSEIIVKHVVTGQTFGVVEGTAISNARTALYATRTFDLFFAGKHGINIFIFGAGEVAKQVILFLNHHAGHSVKSVIVCSPRSSEAFVEDLNAKTTMRFKLEATNNTNNKDQLLAADFVITVTSNSKSSSPLIATKDEMAPGVVTLSLGTNELPSDYLQHALENGIVACDEIDNVSNRGAQALAMHFARQQTTLKEQAPTYGVRELSSMEPIAKNEQQTVHVACSGLAALDILCAAKILIAVAHEKGKELF